MSAQNNKELLNSLNPHQQAYVNLNLQNTKSGEYLLSVFRLLPGKNLNILQAASEVAAESSIDNFALSIFDLNQITALN